MRFWVAAEDGSRYQLETCLFVEDKTSLGDRERRIAEEPGFRLVETGEEVVQTDDSGGFLVRGKRCRAEGID